MLSINIYGNRNLNQGCVGGTRKTPATRTILAGSLHNKVYGARPTSNPRRPVGGKHCQSGSADWLLCELHQLGRAYEKDGAPRPLRVGLVPESSKRITYWRDLRTRRVFRR